MSETNAAPPAPAQIMMLVPLWVYQRALDGLKSSNRGDATTQETIDLMEGERDTYIANAQPAPAAAVPPAPIVPNPSVMNSGSDGGAGGADAGAGNA